MRLNNPEVKSACVVFFLSFLVYFITLCPTVYTWDSGELITAAYTLGVPHSPGYPLYCLIGKLFTLIPFGSVAVRMNVLSAFFASLSSVMLFCIVLRLVRFLNPRTQPVMRILPSLVASLTYAYSATFWSQAVIAEVYTLWIFVLLLSLFILILWAEKNNDRLLYLFSFLYGAAITSHQLSLFFAPGFLFLILSREPKIFLRKGILLYMALAFRAGLCLYLYIPLSAMSNPVINWNKIRNFNGFVDYLGRKQYGEFRQNFSLRYITGILSLNVNKIKQGLTLLGNEFSVTYLFCVFGIIQLFLKTRRYTVFLLLCFLFSFGSIVNTIDGSPLGIYISRVFLLGGYAIIAIFIGLGVYSLAHFYEAKRNKMLSLGVIVMSAFFPVVPLCVNYHQNDQSKNYIAYDFGINMLHTMEKNALLLAQGDNAVAILAYLKLVENRRPDITVYDNVGGDVFKETFFDFSLLAPAERAAFVEELLKKTARPLYITFGHELVKTLKQPKELVGIVYKVLRDKEVTPQERKERYWREYRINDIFYGFLDNKDYLMREIISVYHMALGTSVFAEERAFGFELFRKASEISYNTKLAQELLAMHYSLAGMHAQAIEAIKKIVITHPNDAQAYYNLGVAYAKAGMYKQAIAAWEDVVKLDPGFINVKEYIMKAQTYLSEGKPIH